MSNRDSFGSGFWVGTIFGGVVGGIVGATIASQRNNRLDADLDNSILPSDRSTKRPFKSSRMRSVDRMEVARQRLDAKISDLNNAIDAVRSSIHTPEDVTDPSTKNIVEPESQSYQAGVDSNG